MSTLIQLITLALLIGPSAQVGGGRLDRDSNESRSAASTRPAIGERLTYEVSWSSFVVAGELSIELKERNTFDGIEGLHAVARAQSVGVVRLMGYKVDDTYETFMDPTTLQPFRANKRARHGKKREENSVALDHKNRTARLSDARTFEIPDNTYDLVALFYAVRAMDPIIGKARTFTLIEDGKLYTLLVEPEAREKVRTRSGSYDVIRVATKTVQGGKVKDPYGFRFFITTDSRRLPVLMTAEPAWGQVRMELTSQSSVRPVRE